MSGDERVSFAEQVAALRSRAGLSLADVAAAAHVVRGYVHHIEHGHRWPTQRVAKALDTTLGADGALLAAWEAGEATARPVPADPDEFERFSAALANPRCTDTAVVNHLARILAEQRCAEDTLGARRLLPPVLAQIQVIDGLVRQARGPVRAAVLEVAAHYDEFAGWMYQDATERALDRSAALTYAVAEHPDQAPPWVYFQGPERLAFQRGVAYVELGRHADAVPLLSTALENLAACYERDRARYAAQLALALAGSGDADGALTVAMRAAELAATTGSALAARELRRVRASLREHGAEAQARALAEHVHALADKLG